MTLMYTDVSGIFTFDHFYRNCYKFYANSKDCDHTPRSGTPVLFVCVLFSRNLGISVFKGCY